MPGATTNYAFPYQILTDPPHGPNLGENLAVAVDDALATAEATAAAATAAVQSDLNATETALDGRLDTLEAGVPARVRATVNPPATVAANGGHQEVVVTFPVGMFSTPPDIKVLHSNSGRLNLAVINLTASGFTLGMDNHTGTSVGTSTILRWMAEEAL